jgi:hypothetical protein
MTHLFLLFFLTISVSQAVCDENTAEEVIKSAKLHGFTCTKQKLEFCSYTECKSKEPEKDKPRDPVFGTYPMPALITIPESVNSLRVHFHGHILGSAVSSQYEGNLSEMNKAYGIQNSLCTNSEVTVFPQSTGKNQTYKDFFKDNNAYTNFLKEIHNTLGNHLKDSPLHLSGHSGGGKYVAGALNAGIATSKVSIFDGIYSTETKNSLKNWYNKGEGKLTIATVTGGDYSPAYFTKILRNELGDNFTSSKSTIKGTIYDVKKSDRFIHYNRDYSASAHFKTVTEIWPATN